MFSQHLLWQKQKLKYSRENIAFHSHFVSHFRHSARYMLLRREKLFVGLCSIINAWGNLSTKITYMRYIIIELDRFRNFLSEERNSFSRSTWLSLQSTHIYYSKMCFYACIRRAEDEKTIQILISINIQKAGTLNVLMTLHSLYVIISISSIPS